MKTPYATALHLLPVLLLACADEAAHDESPEPFSLRFAAVAGDRVVQCGDSIDGVGPQGTHSVSIADLRFYVSNLRFVDAAGQPVELNLEQNEFQRTAADGSVALIDLAGTAQGACAPDSIAFAEGTARTNDLIRGTTRAHHVAGVAFDVGVPQAVMKSTIAATTPEGAPSPLNEMYWSWNSGYRHLVFNFAVSTSTGATGDGYLHVGSRDCGAGGGKALEDRVQCSFVNTPSVVLADFSLDTGVVGIDLTRLVAGLEMKGPEAACHSGPGSADCIAVFNNLGLDMASGSADASQNEVFVGR